ncbi:hypothetical protein ACLKA7_015062 [Drosophila subpalustris]
MSKGNAIFISISTSAMTAWRLSPARSGRWAPKNCDYEYDWSRSCRRCSTWDQVKMKMKKTQSGQSSAHATA